MAMTKADVAGYNANIIADEIVLDMKEYFTFLEGMSYRILERTGVKAGKTVDIPVRGQLGSHQTKAEGIAMATDEFTTSKLPIVMAVRALEVDFTLEADGAYDGDLSADIKDALSESLRNTVDTILFETFATTTETAIGDGTETINLDLISQAISATKVKDKSKLTLYISFDQEHQLRVLVDANGNQVFNPTTQYELLQKGVIGTIFGVKIAVDEKITATAGVYTNYLVQDGAVILVWDPTVNTVESGKNYSTQVYSVYSTAVIGVELDPNKSVVPIEFAEVEVVTP